MGDIYLKAGDTQKAKEHKALHDKHKVDDNAHDTVIAKARANNKAADHAAEMIAIYELENKESYKPVKYFISNNNIRVE